jgi:two-component system nitrate/nitrite response regulator NarL
MKFRQGILQLDDASGILMGDMPSLSILILEDQGLVRAGMRELVQICEPKSLIHEASSYEVAVEKLGSRHHDLAFLDVDLKSDKSGFDVLQYIRSQEIETRAVMLSGQSDRDLIMKCIDAGASGYILKDMESDGLFRRALDTIFQGGVFLPASALGKGGFTPSSNAIPPAIPVDSLGLPNRAIEALYYLCQGLANKTIAHKMGIAESTVRQDYMTTLFRFFGVARRTQLMVEISRRGIVIPPPSSPSLTMGS